MSFNGQMIGVYYSPRMFKNEKLVESAILEAKRMGYKWVAFHAGWNTGITVADIEVYDAVKKAIGFARKQGLKCMLDMTPEWWTRSYVDLYPNAAQWVITKADGYCKNGKFAVTGVMPKLGDWQIVFEKVLSAYIFEKENKYKLVKVDVEFEQFSHSGKFQYLLHGKLNETYNGRIVLYSAFAIYRWMDFAHPDYLKLQKQLLDMYKDVKLDGIQWDEPGKMFGIEEGYKAGEGFLKFFKELKEYDLAEKLICLDEYTGTEEATKVRIDYYSALNEMLFNAQKSFNEYARTIFGNIEFGIHQTWSGFHTDFKSGCVDYFKLGKVLTGAFTDCAWGLGATTYNYYLADSIRKELGFMDAIVNDWNIIITSEQLNYFGRIKLLFNLKWKNIFVGDYGDKLPLYPIERIDKALKDKVENLDKFNEIIKDKYYARSDTAIWHGWEGIAYLNNENNTLRFYEDSLWDFCERALENEIWFDFVSTSAVEKLDVKDSFIVINGIKYTKLILPYALAISSKMWEKIKFLVERNIPVIFAGPFPQIIIETGENISSYFCKMLGIKEFNLEDYFRCFKGKLRGNGRWENMNIFPGQDELLRILLKTYNPIEHVSKNTEIKSDEDEVIIYVKNKNVYYVPSTPGTEDLFEIIKNIDDKKKFAVVKKYGENSFCRIFESKENKNDFIVVIVAKKLKELNEILEINEKEIEVNGGTKRILIFKDKKLLKEI